VIARENLNMRLLIIGSLSGQIGAASQIAISRGAKVMQVGSIEAALQLLRAGEGADLLMIDVQEDIRSLVVSLQTERISVPVVACGIGNDTESAVRAIKAGAKEYIPLPPSADLIASVLTAVTEERHAIIHRDPQMAEILKLADQVAPSDASVLITGSSGTGKELVARYLHGRSPRANKRFVAVNCAAIPENLLESELFGHEKGAFTGAVARRLGKFEEASDGTLLLDEISEMDVRLQAKLLRAVQEREIDRVGGSKPVKVNARIVATSNRDMAEHVANGNFREDLYFRLNVINIHLPNLQGRPEDIEALAGHFIEKYAAANGLKALPLSDKAIKKLVAFDWPGNVRELENCMHRTVLLASGDEIAPDAIMLTSTASRAGQKTEATEGHPQGQDAGGLPARVGQTVAHVERELIIETLEHCLGNRTHAANILGISIRTLRNKLKQYIEQGLSIPMPGDAERPSA